MYLEIANFKYGLDARRSELSTAPGALATLENAFVNQGGEIEKRKAFVLTTLPTGTFGLEPTSSGWVTFGSIAEPTGLGGVAYQRLQHPDGSTAMTSVVHSTTFSGAAFVIAEYADGNRYPFYNGTRVSDFTAGLVLTGETDIPSIAAAFVALANEQPGVADYTPTTPSVIGGTSQVDLFGPVGREFTLEVDETSTSGTLTVSKRADAISAVVGTSALGLFRIVAGTVSAGVNRITMVKVGTVEVIGSPVNFTTSVTGTATAIQGAINAHTSAPDYTSTASGDVVRILSDPLVGSAANGLVIEVTATGDVCVGGAGFTIDSSVTSVDSIVEGATTILGTPVSRGTDTFAVFCAAIATAIRAGSGTHGYTACAVGTGIWVSKLVSRSDDTEPNITMTYTGGSVTSAAPTGIPAGLAAALDRSSVTGSRNVDKHSGTFAVSASQSVNCSATGGVPTYSYLWSEATTGSGNGITITGSTTSQASFWANVVLDPENGFGTVSGLFKCTVTDSDTPATAVASGYVSVTLSVYSTI
jgi:hypothetical protein